MAHFARIKNGIVDFVTVGRDDDENREDELPMTAGSIAELQLQHPWRRSLHGWSTFCGSVQSLPQELRWLGLHLRFRA
jgi:hypothetical protein